MTEITIRERMEADGPLVELLLDGKVLSSSRDTADVEQFRAWIGQVYAEARDLASKAGKDSPIHDRT